MVVRAGLALWAVAYDDQPLSITLYAALHTPRDPCLFCFQDVWPGVVGRLGRGRVIRGAVNSRRSY